MLFKYISYLQLWWPFCSAKLDHLGNFGRGSIRNICEIILNLDQWFRRKYCLNTFYLQLWQPFCSLEQKHLDNFGRGPQEEHLCEVILNLAQWFRRCRLKNKFTHDRCWTKTDHNSSP